MNASTHGTVGGYSNHKCRCDKCRAAWNEYCRDAKRRRTASADGFIDTEKHDERTYQKGCRCVACKREHAKHSLAQYHLRHQRQKPADACDCCGSWGPLVADHDHDTMALRGWLCNRCNTGIGALGDSIDGIRRAIDYLNQAVD